MVQLPHLRGWQERGGWGRAGDSQRAPSAPAADLGASPFGRRPQPPLSCDLRLNHAPNWGQNSVRGGRIPPLLMLPPDCGVLSSREAVQEFPFEIHKSLPSNGLRISSLIKVASLLARTYGKKRRILGQPPRCELVALSSESSPPFVSLRSIDEQPGTLNRLQARPASPWAEQARTTR